MDAPKPPRRTPAREPSDRLPGLDMLRGIAALCVLHFHVMGVFFAGTDNNGKGYLAVDFFFMLSGYVMARTYEQRLREGYGARRFMAGRYRRLWPVMAIGVLIGAPMAAVEIGDPGLFAVVAAANLFLIPVVTATVLFPINTPAWSILAELAANLMHAVLLWRIPFRHLILVPLLLLPALAAIAIHFGSLDVGVATASAYAGILRALFAYSIGILLWRWWRDRPRIEVPPPAAFVAMPALMLAGQASHASGWAIDLAFIVLACPLLIAGGLNARGENRVAHWLGAISFPLYAINSSTLHWAEGLGLSPLTGIACALALAAYIAHRMNPRPRPEPTVVTA